MIARLPRTKIAKTVWLSSLLAPFLLSALAQTISAQTTDLQTKATRPAQISLASSANKDTVPGQKTVKRPPSTRMKSQVSKAPLKVHPTAASTSAPAVPGVNDFAPGKIVISNGGAKEVRLQLTPTSTPAEAEEQRRQTRNLLWISNENLKRIAGHDLDANQQDMLEQVHNYMTQARVADKAGELQRAQILAYKARQLSDDLAGVRTILKLWPW
jgi:hypothetical protein